MSNDSNLIKDTVPKPSKFFVQLLSV